MTTPTILAVDDEPIFRFLLETHLREAGFTPATASNGIEALAFLERHQVDLIVSDLLMPDMDGIELIAQVQKLYPGIPIIVITAQGAGSSAGHCRR